MDQAQQHPTLREWVPVRGAVAVLAIATLAGLAGRDLARVAGAGAVSEGRADVTGAALIGLITAVVAVVVGVRWGAASLAPRPWPALVRDDALATVLVPAGIAVGAAGCFLAWFAAASITPLPIVHRMLLGAVLSAPAWAAYGSLCSTIGRTRGRGYRIAIGGVFLLLSSTLLWILATGDDPQPWVHLALFIFIPAPTLLVSSLVILDRVRYIMLAGAVRYFLIRRRARR